MEIWKAIILGIVEGLTEFLPVSSTGHLTVTEQLLNLPIDDVAITGFTAVIQMGAILAAVIYFWKDIARIVGGFFAGAVNRDRRGFDYRFGWYVIVGSIPVGVAGLLFKGVITGPLRSLWVVAAGLLGWSVVMVFAERAATQQRSEKEVTLADAGIIGLTQVFALIPGVSRSGATISAGLFRGLDRVTATRLSFFLGIPALFAAGLFELKDALHGQHVGVAALAVGTLVSFVVGYASIAWLLRFVARHTLIPFVWYRVAVGLLLVGLLVTGAVDAA